MTDRDGTMVAATDTSLRGRDFSQTGWFQRARETKIIQIDDVAVHDPDNGTGGHRVHSADSGRGGDIS